MLSHPQVGSGGAGGWRRLHKALPQMELVDGGLTSEFRIDRGCKLGKTFMWRIKLQLEIVIG
jgi:hypothetical protein